ncbi:MAG: hypothetical protein A2X05_07045 [Bacteroidetes bacterium GWE2_41_25]|nr:MAG: hypothetical protein A2X05_07045 [Bacteroidetes bacterium GWE2_41_25]HCU20432.1 hypothetical protein [Bacteroidales bacterium]
MKPAFCLLLSIILSDTLLNAQAIKGKITDQSGEPVPYSTVYIQELKQGTTANTKGDYEIKLPAGKYTVIYQSLGYEQIFATISLTDKPVIKNITLPLQYYQIPEVRITASDEDPAYIIMRKVIGMAPYYLNNINYYKAELYLKGNLFINKIPKLLQKSMAIEAKKESGGSVSSQTIKEGEAYLMESFNEIEFNAPDKYFQKVISSNSTFPEQGNDISPMDYIQASFYQPVIADMAVSPLAPNAFSHYRYKYLGATLQGIYTINKIQVIPKRKSQQVFEGTIFIIEDLWCLHSVDLSNENLVGKVRIQELYIPVQDDIWMPVSHKFDVNISIVGFKADAGYGGSVKYIDVKPNLALAKPKTISVDFTGPEKPDTTVTKTKQQIEKILAKDDLSNRDMVKLSRLMEKESEKSVPDSIRNNLEIQERTTHEIEKDAGRKDSSYWAQVRPVPLSEIEVRSIRRNDSLKALYSPQKVKSDTTSGTDKEKKSMAGRKAQWILLGHTWSDTTGFSFTHGGLPDMKNLTFNTVDGFTYGLNFRLSKSWNEGRSSISFFPDIRYAFSRKQLMWRLNSQYVFDGLNQRQIYLRIGMTSKDIGNGGGINPFLNSVTSLFFEKNYLKLYDSRFMIPGFRTEIVNGLNLDISTTLEDRRVLEHTTDFKFISSTGEYTDNIPHNAYLDSTSNSLNFLTDQRHADITAKLTYTPFQRYRINKGRKIPRGSDWPTFILSWQHGFNEIPEIDGIRQYDMIRFEVYKNQDIAPFSKLRWRFRTGGFTDNRNVPFYDFFHFNPQPPMVLLDDYQDAFMLPAYYSLSTPEAFGEFHIKYTTPYLLIKLLPGISNTLMRENVSLSYLGSRNNPHYTELGYSISEIFFMAELGVYVGFEDFGYKSIGGKLVLKFN